MPITDTVNQPGVVPKPPLHIASPATAPGWDGAFGPLLCGAMPDPVRGFYAGLDAAYRAHVEGWSGPTPPVCPDCLRVALIAMGAEAAPPPDPSVPAFSVRLDAMPPERRAEFLAEWRRLLAEEPPGRIEVIPAGLPPAAENALRAVLLFHGDAYWSAERRAEWLALTGRKDATTRALCDTVRAVLGDAGGEDRV